jgi:hypothetical protein
VRQNRPLFNQASRLEVLCIRTVTGD